MGQKMSPNELGPKKLDQKKFQSTRFFKFGKNWIGLYSNYDKC